MLLLKHSSPAVASDRLLAFRLRAFHLRVKISSAVSADLLLEKFSPTVIADSSRMLIHVLWLFAKSDILKTSLYILIYNHIFPEIKQ